MTYPALNLSKHIIKIILFFASCLFSIRAFCFDTPADIPTPEVLKLAATQWCPYICEDKSKPGFIVEFMTAALSAQGVEIKIDVLPWSRAIMAAKDGNYHGLLTSTPAESPDFIFPAAPTGYYQMCFFGKKQNSFKFVDRSSLQNVNLGVVKDYGYGEPMDAIIAAPIDGERIQIITNSTPLLILVEMTRFGRIDIFIEDKMVTNNFMKNYERSHNIKELSCFDEIPFFTGISKNIQNKSFWVEIINNALTTEQANGIYQSALRKYIQPVSK